MHNADAHFVLLGLEPTFDLDPATLEAAYFKQQRLFHPDRFVGKPASERQAALLRSVDINDAYLALKEPLTRAQALLAQHHVQVGTDADTVKPPQSLLVETLHWRESIDDATTPDALIAEANTLQTLNLHCLSQLSALYRERNWPEMAQQTLRLGYIEKALQAIHQKRKRLEKTAS